MGAQNVVAKQVVVANRLGLHARPASLFVRTASRFAAEISVANAGTVGDGRSVLGLLTLAAGQGTTLEVTASGADAPEALEAIEHLFLTRFGED